MADPFDYKALVMPDNTPAMLHLYDQFQKQQQLRDANKAKEAEDELKRKEALAKRLDGISPKDSETETQEFITNIKPKLQELIQEHGGKNSLKVGFEISKAADEAVRMDAILKGITKKTAEGINNLEKLHKNIDKNAALEIVTRYARYKTDPKTGKPVKKTLDELEADLNSPDDIVAKALQSDWNLIYDAETSNNDWKEFIEKSPKEKPNEKSQYDAEGNLVQRGYNGEIPTGILSYTPDKDGNVTYAPRSQNYRIPGQNYDVLDKDGKPIKVVSDEVFKQVYNNPSLAAPIERKVREELETTATSFNGTDNSMFSPDSDYADMLRRKYVYEELDARTKGRYVFNKDEDKSNDKKQKINDEKWNRYVEAERLRVSKQNASTALLNYKLRKQAKKQGIKDFKLTSDWLGDIVSNRGEEVEIEISPEVKSKKGGIFTSAVKGKPQQTKKVKFISFDGLPVGDKEIILGNGKNQIAVKPKTYKLKDGREVKGWIYNETAGRLEGDGETLSKKNAQERFLKYTPDMGKMKSSDYFSPDDNDNDNEETY